MWSGATSSQWEVVLVRSFAFCPSSHSGPAFSTVIIILRTIVLELLGGSIFCLSRSISICGCWQPVNEFQSSIDFSGVSLHNLGDFPPFMSSWLKLLCQEITRLKCDYRYVHWGVVTIRPMQSSRRCPLQWYCRSLACSYIHGETQFSYLLSYGLKCHHYNCPVTTFQTIDGTPFLQPFPSAYCLDLDKPYDLQALPNS